MGFLSSDKLIVGYDLGNEYSQISVSVSGSEEVTTLSLVAGAENYNIPTVLCKRNGVNQWFYGKEAIRYAKEEQGILVENLLDLALDGEPVAIEGETFEPAALLALFFKRSLGMLSQVGSPDRIEALMITCGIFNKRLVEVLEDVLTRVRLAGVKIAFQSHTESYYTYMLYQPEELWIQPSVLFFHQGDNIRAYCLECNRRTIPTVVFIEERDFPFRDRADQQGEDGAFLDIAAEVCQEKKPGSVYLIGDSFSEERMKDSLKYLCRDRRVFQGTNLFSKGACHGMQERLNISEAGKRHVFLSSDKLKANIGINILRQGEEIYYALLDAGSNWYEAAYSTEIYMQDGNVLTLAVTPLIGGSGKAEDIVLEDFPGDVARLQVRLYMETEDCLTAEIHDMGFGDFRKPSGRVWKRTIQLY